MIQDVEGLGTKLDRQSFPEFRVLNNGEIVRNESGSDELVPRLVAQRSDGRERERGRIEPLLWIVRDNAAHTPAWGEIGPVNQIDGFSQARNVKTDKGGKRMSAACRHNIAQLPSFYKLVAVEWKLIENGPAEILRGIKGTQAAVLRKIVGILLQPGVIFECIRAGAVVDALGPGVIGLHIQAVTEPLVQ